MKRFTWQIFSLMMKQARIQGVGARAGAHPWDGGSPLKIYHSKVFKHQFITGRPPLGEILYPPLEGVPIALPPPPPMGVCPSTCPPPQSKFLRRGPAPDSVQSQPNPGSVSATTGGRRPCPVLPLRPSYARQCRCPAGVGSVR